MPATLTPPKAPTHPIVRDADGNAFLLLMRTRIAMQDLEMDDELAKLEVQAARLIEEIISTATASTSMTTYLKFASIVMKWAEIRK